MTTVPKDNMPPPIQPPMVSSASPMTGKGQVNLGPPKQPGAYPAAVVTGLGPSLESPLPPHGKPFAERP